VLTVSVQSDVAVANQGGSDLQSKEVAGASPPGWFDEDDAYDFEDEPPLDPAEAKKVLDEVSALLIPF
jgi:hypothetical protein